VAVLKMMRGIALGGLINCLVLAVAPSSANAGTLRVGDKLPAATLTDWDGTTVQLAAPPAGVMVVDFWASWCEACRTALPELNAIGQRYAADGLQVVAVNIDKRRAPADAFLQTYMSAPAMMLLRDPGGEILARYGAAGMPALYVIDQAGLVRLVESGFTVEKLHAVEALVTKLLNRGGNP